MALHPKVQARAQAEIDTATGGTRLPAFEDRASMPYVDALLRELHRWGPVIPLGTSTATSQNALTIGYHQAIPHVLMEDDEYDGYRILKGSYVFGNTW